MDNPFIALVLPSLLIVPAMGLLSSVDSTSPIGCELRRKTLHIVVGLAALLFPLMLTETWMVIGALSLVVAWMLSVRHVPALNSLFGCVLHSAGRKSHGEIWFAIAVAGLLLSSPENPALYVVPILVLTVSDALAAIIGRSWPAGRMTGLAKGKTVSGSCAFFLSAFLISVCAVGIFTVLPGSRVLVISIAVAGLTCLTEAVCSRGLDNLAVPAVAWLIIQTSIAGGLL